jgi:signal transduction histidine kinase/ActR/RegA family two-component response regulator/HPt (histidine-containing phosphotransfer) domain-containing protein
MLRKLPRLPRDALVLILGAVVITSFTLGGALMLWRARADALEEWRGYVGNFSVMAAEHASATLKTADVLLQRIIDKAGAEGVETQEELRAALGDKASFDMMVERAHEAPQIDVASIVAANGDIINFTREFPPPGINVSDRDYFQAHMHSPELEVFLSVPVANRATGRFTFYLARKIHGRSGRVIGLALAGIESRYFEDFYQAINMSPEHARISLFRNDGMLLAQFPPVRDHVGRSNARGTVFSQFLKGVQEPTIVRRHSTTERQDDTRLRIISPRATKAYPLVVNLTVTEDLILARWRSTALYTAIGLALFDILLGGLVLRIFRLTRKRRITLEQLEAARAGAESANAAKSTFLANMSHEMRTPLHGMLGLAAMILATPLSPQQRRHAEMLRNSGKALVEIIDSLLDFSRIESGRMEFEQVDFDLVAVATDAAALFQARATERGLHLEVHIDPAVPRLVRGDPLRLGQVLNNLVSNAIKFTPAGGVTVTVKRGPGARIAFEVADSGIGISALEMTRIFEPFAQADSGTTRRFGGTGLGLAIVKRLVTQQGGEIGVSSPDERGSRFWFWLPLPAAAAAGDANPPRETAAEAEPCYAGEVLLAEDNEINMEVACAMVAALGMTARQARSGREALEQFRRQAPALILMDVQMPDMDGLAATARIRELEAILSLPRTPIIALTANAMPADRQCCLDAGMDDFLGKPYSLAELAAALGRHLESAVPCAAPAPAAAGPRADDEIGIALRSADDVSPGLANVLIDTFIRTAPPYLEEMRREGAPAAEVERAAHSLRSSSRRLGALFLSEIAGTIETLARDQRLDEALESLPALALAVDNACRDLALHRA